MWSFSKFHCFCSVKDLRILITLTRSFMLQMTVLRWTVQWFLWFRQLPPPAACCLQRSDWERRLSSTASASLSSAIAVSVCMLTPISVCEKCKIRKWEWLAPTDVLWFTFLFVLVSEAHKKTDTDLQKAVSVLSPDANCCHMTALC